MSPRTTAGVKRRAAWDEPRRLPPKMRVPEPRVAVNQVAKSKPATPLTASIMMPPTPGSSPLQPFALDFADKSAENPDDVYLRRALSKRTQEEAVELLMSLARKDRRVRLTIENENRRMAKIRKKKCDKARALNFDDILKRVEQDLYEKKPRSRSYEKTLEEALNVTARIALIFRGFSEHCSKDDPSDIKCGTMVTVATIWDLVIFAPPSEARTECLGLSLEWEGATLSLWKRMSELEQKSFASHAGVVKTLIKTAMEWEKHGEREDMFNRWLQKMKKASDGTLSAEYAKWDARIRLPNPQHQPSSPPLANLTLE
ncbi:unnamed protein product [Clonostachys rosea]|uniref:NWD NACHT-NTPase N-terminal domain-containing protein n=1 Tax=Bionectria ochroleuca TaxID=29856 RepID=A0ABY6URQ9_BIOOC|nr:unnamed protein product [Clonostachys rosea]